MSRRRRTEITVETRQLFLLRSVGNGVQAWCAKCTPSVRMISPEQAAALAGVSTRTIYALVEAGKVHFIETSAGLLLVCLDSLFAGTSQL
jgi:excisionase family DNA binding protein